MRKLSFFPRLAWQSVRNNRRFYVPYILTVLGTTAAFYILSALFFDPGRFELASGTTHGSVYVQSFMMIGMLFLGIFSCIFLASCSSTSAAARSTRDTTSPMPSMREAMRSG